MPRARTRPSVLARSALALTLAGCGHTGAAAGPSTAPEPAIAAPAPAPPPTDANHAPTAAQVITFDADEPEAEPTTLVRSAPKRPPIPAFQLFGTRAGDGP